ncbi:ABC-2 family transporter protein [Candidatus Micrarchaeota archaeon]|nr:ABC-2 family transporter protein [Candidatus Micrarchaeota archaeon]
MRKEYLSLLRSYLSIDLKRLVEYRADFTVMLFSSVIVLAVNFIFWQAVFAQARVINGWTFGDIILLEGFFALTMTVVGLFGEGMAHLDELVIQGWLDTYLVKPISPLITIMLTNIALFELQGLAVSIVYFMVAASLGTSITIGGFLAGMAISMMGALVLIMIMSCIAMLVFWFGRTSALHVLFSIVYETGGGTPGTIYPGSVQLAFMVGVPILFMQTMPALAALGRLDFGGLVGILAMEAVVALAWFAIAWFAWRKGLRRYESYGG